MRTRALHHGVHGNVGESLLAVEKCRNVECRRIVFVFSRGEVEKCRSSQLQRALLLDSFMQPGTCGAGTSRLCVKKIRLLLHFYTSPTRLKLFRVFAAAEAPLRGCGLSALATSASPRLVVCFNLPPKAGALSLSSLLSVSFACFLSCWLFGWCVRCASRFAFCLWV